jgi:hypothetical protein
MNKKSSLLIILIILFWSSLLFSQQSLESKFISRVSQKRLQQNVHELVRFGNRLGGTKSGDNAARFIANRFKSYGFKPALLKDPEKLCYSYDNWQLRIEEPRRLRGLIQHEWLANYSPSVKLDTARLTLANPHGKIKNEKLNHSAVLLEQPPTKKMYEELADAGASCILSYETKNTSAYSNWAMISNLAESNANRIPLFNISNVSGKRLRAEIEKGTSVLIRYSSKTSIGPANPKTVIATIKGQSDDYYIICAHGDSDSGGPGADDNASGVSGVLEIANIFSTLTNNKILPTPKFSIKFVIWGTEYYSAGSYVKLHENELSKIRGVINFDEIGIRKSRNCIYFEGNDIQHNHDMLRLFEKIGEDYVDKKGFWEEATTNPCQGGTDSYVFLPSYLDRLGLPEVEIPSITVFTAAWNEPKSIAQTRGWRSKAWKGKIDSIAIDYSPYYHSSLDIPAFTTDKEPANMVWAVNAVGIALIRLLYSEE